MQKINLLNKQIFEYSEELEKAFCEDTRYFPARINFYIQKTAHSLKQAKEEIEETREKIILNYGKYDAETGYCEVLPQNINFSPLPLPAVPEDILFLSFSPPPAAM